mmetsp:Transcript_42533/g.105937  ORF Transcript_42533/g.105937 Transcript_42533/m.105937 type:complete len:150 (-) Transcript_42533:1085-1534(-)
MALNGKNPAMKTWHGPCLYHGIGGISRGIRLVRHGTHISLPLAKFRPRIPPMTVNGSVINAQMQMITRMVPIGRAVCELYAMATVLRKLNMRKRGTGKSVPLSTRLKAQRPISVPISLQYKCADTKPANPAVKAYKTIAAVYIAPRFPG